MLEIPFERQFSGSVYPWVTDRKTQPDVSTTGNEDDFFAAVQAGFAECVTYRRPLSSREHSAIWMRDAFNEWAETSHRVPCIAFVETETDINGNIIYNDALPPGDIVYHKELKPALAVLSHLGYPKAFTWLAQDSLGIMSAVENGFEGKGKQRAVPALMAHFTVAGRGAMSASQREILSEAEWGYFPPGVPLLLHGYSERNASLSLIVVPEPENAPAYL